MLALIALCLISSGGALYQTSGDAITELTDAGPQIEGSQVWAVHFYSEQCAECVKYAPEFARAARAASKFVRFGSVDVDRNPALRQQYNIETVPNIKLLGFKGKELDYAGPKTGQDLVETILDQLTVGAKLALEDKQDLIVQLDDDNFEHLVRYSGQDWFVQFHAPWCVHCRKLSPIWAEVAVALKDKVQVGTIDVTVNAKTANQLGVFNLPTLQYFPRNKTSMQYPGMLLTSDIINWASEQYLNNLAVPQVEQLINSEVYLKQCQLRQLCLVLFVPELYDCGTDCRYHLLETLQKGTEDYVKRYNWGYVWSEARQQDKLEQHLDIGGTGYPELVVLNPGKQSFLKFHGTMDVHSIDLFLQDLLRGQGGTYKLPQNMEIVPVEAWTGSEPQLDFVNLENGDVFNNAKQEL